MDRHTNHLRVAVGKLRQVEIASGGVLGNIRKETWHGGVGKITNYLRWRLFYVILKHISPTLFLSKIVVLAGCSTTAKSTEVNGEPFHTETHCCFISTNTGLCHFLRPQLKSHCSRYSRVALWFIYELYQWTCKCNGRQCNYFYTHANPWIIVAPLDSVWALHYRHIVDAL